MSDQDLDEAIEQNKDAQRVSQALADSGRAAGADAFNRYVGRHSKLAAEHQRLKDVAAEQAKAAAADAESRAALEQNALLGEQLVGLLSRHAGETGKSEGAVEVLERKLAELSAAEARIADLGYEIGAEAEHADRVALESAVVVTTATNADSEPTK